MNDQTQCLKVKNVTFFWDGGSTLYTLPAPAPAPAQSVSVPRLLQAPDRAMRGARCHRSAGVRRQLQPARPLRVIACKPPWAQQVKTPTATSGFVICALFRSCYPGRRRRRRLRCLLCSTFGWVMRSDERSKLILSLQLASHSPALQWLLICQLKRGLTPIQTVHDAHARGLDGSILFVALQWKKELNYGSEIDILYAQSCSCSMVWILVHACSMPSKLDGSTGH
jgi:hypothetical protein